MTRGHLGLLALLLIVFLVPRWIRWRHQHDASACHGNIKKVGTALEIYSSENGAQFPDALDKLVPRYIATIPTCPGAGGDSYSSSYSVAHKKDADAYTFFCQGANHTGTGLSANFPQYTSRLGLLTK